MPTTMTQTFTGDAYDMMERIVSKDWLLDTNVFRNKGGEFEIFKAGNEVTRKFEAAIREVKEATEKKEDTAKADWGAEPATQKQMSFARKLADRDPALASTFGVSSDMTKTEASRFISNMLSEGV